jgi:hypothetical protein
LNIVNAVDGIYFIQYYREYLIKYIPSTALTIFNIYPKEILDIYLNQV